MLAKSEKVKVDKSILEGRRVAVVRSLFNEELTGSMLESCVSELVVCGFSRDFISVYEVPGALEIPIVCRLIAQQDLAQVIIALGVVIKGDTYHFELVANECARGCTIVSQEFTIPIVFEVLAVYSLAQAKKRAGKDENNKGIEAARAAVKMLEIVSSF